MKLRIIAHAGCTDGYGSAFVVKKYGKYLIHAPITKDDLAHAEILPFYPGDVQTGNFAFTSGDIVVDLPRPKSDILFWCDHHATTKPESGEPLPQNNYWKITPSCTGYLLDLAFQNGLNATPELREFQKVMDTIDAAEYTPAEIKECYYSPSDFNNLTALQKIHAIGSMFNTRDRILNLEIFKTLLTARLGETPLSSPALWQLNPLMFYRAQLLSYQEWRENVDTYLVYDADAKCVVQDDRKTAMTRGVADRFYACIKFPQSSYNLSLKPIDPETMRLGLGSNIFHKERCKVDLGKLCRDVGKKFGTGAGGGHYYVGGGVIKTENGDAGIEYVLKKLKEGENK
ncbi:hypothetical protein HY496_01785 [Candidatus Woesearchaeota archaeon]|nr:hypothetical protein [Candidatus Woesearchaeota archaeon]